MLCRPPVLRSDTGNRNSRAPATSFELLAQAGDHVVGGDLALAEGLQRDIDEAGIGLPAAGEADDSRDRRIVLHDRLQLRELLLHRLEGDALIALDDADQQARVLHRKQA